MVKAVAVLSSIEGVSGTIFFNQEAEGVPTTVTGDLSGLKPGPHGFHVRALSHTTNGFMSTGPHCNPDPHGKEHGAPDNEVRHADDPGNVTEARCEDGNILCSDAVFLHLYAGAECLCTTQEQASCKLVS
ncbi:hypothetical protein M8C21_017068 [Ambrosia artemisiifolia]|uniref:Superoxide dismutase copper/zinc binding domain-containing protein n=1 Tax=Ambrosia artemisiifolia TaxID=4212 RepID=A0AAD5GDL8_AMBAR|nr:hypothetical protein M8C21_017068 [Ambrosia artemisiifolia]